MASDTTPSLIIQRIVRGLRTKMSLTEDQVYECVAPTYVEGQPPLVIQVCPGADTTEGGGRGAQEGGGLGRRMMVNLTVWSRVLLDQHGRSEQALVESANGLIDLSETIRGHLAMTTLGGATTSPVRYEAMTTPAFYDIDAGVVRRDLSFSAEYWEDLPTTVTLTAADVGAE